MDPKPQSRPAAAGSRRPPPVVGVAALVPGAADYPPRLGALGAELSRLNLLKNPLWLRGEVSALQARPAVTVVGSRAASAAGEALAHALAAAVAEQGGLVISGGAMGIDAAAHRGALVGQGLTCAVLGCGVDVVYPLRHARLFAEIVQRGCLLSSFALGEPPVHWHFPVRNELMAALADLVVVIEARADSGSLITVEHARHHGRPVAAFPGSPGAELALRSGAHLVHTVADVMALAVQLSRQLPQELSRQLPSQLPLQLTGPTAAGVDDRAVRAHATSGVCAPAAPAPSFNDESTADAVLAELAALSRGVDLGELCARTGLQPGDCAAALVDLELRGRCTRLAGGRYTMHAPLS